jgi:hypothetical protein
MLGYLISKIGYSLITLLQYRVTTRVVRNGSLRNVPFVGQYCIFDVFYIMGHTMTSLPHKLSDFKKLVQKYFPTLIDTKIMGARFKHIISPNFMTGLSSMVNYFLGRGPQSLKDPNQRLVLNSEEIFESEMKHDAGYDAFVTGFVFLNLTCIVARGEGWIKGKEKGW